MSPEDLYTHGALKVEMVRTLGSLVIDTGLGDLQSDRSRFRSPFARVTTEPDIVAVFRESIESGRARLVPSARRKGQNRIVAFEGAVRAFHLQRSTSHRSLWSYRLEHKSPA